MGIFVLTPPPPTPESSEETEIPTYTGNINNVYYGMYVLLSQIEQELSNIKLSLATMASTSTNVSNRLTTIATNSTTLTTNLTTNLTTIAEKITAMETYQKRLKELGESSGIRIISPYEAFSFVTSYRSLIEEGRILKWRDAEPSDKDVSKALNDLERYIEKIRNNVPRAF
jgi:hypothetical protein